MRKSDIERIRERHNNIPQDGFPEVEEAVKNYVVRVTGTGRNSIGVIDDAYEKARLMTPGAKPVQVEQVGAIEENYRDASILQGAFEFTYDREAH